MPGFYDDPLKAPKVSGKESFRTWQDREREKKI